MSDNILLSELYGRQIITNTGSIIGSVEDIIVDFEEGKVATILLVKSEEIIRSDQTSRDFIKKSVKYDRVRSVGETIIVSSEPIKH